MSIKPRAIYCIAILGILFILAAPVIFTRNALFDGIEFDTTGQIGDTIGGTTAPFVGLISITLLVYTLYQQLEFNKRENKLSLDEQFKATFFQLLDQQRKLADELEFNGYLPGKSWSPSKIRLQGLNAFRGYSYKISHLFKFFDSDKFCTGLYKEEYDSQMSALNNLEEQQPNIDLGEQYRELYAERLHNIMIDEYSLNEKIHGDYRHNELSEPQRIAFVYSILYNHHLYIGRYFRHLFYILKVTKREEEKQLDIISRNKNGNSEESESVKNAFRTYAQFIPAQMSNEELLLLFYNCFLFPKMMELVIHYNLLQTLSSQALSLPSHRTAANGIELTDKSKPLKRVLGEELYSKLHIDR